jgi:hypothetical protein
VGTGYVDLQRLLVLVCSSLKSLDMRGLPDHGVFLLTVDNFAEPERKLYYFAVYGCCEASRGVI